MATLEELSVWLMLQWCHRWYSSSSVWLVKHTISTITAFLSSIFYFVHGHSGLGFVVLYSSKFPRWLLRWYWPLGSCLEKYIYRCIVEMKDHTDAGNCRLYKTTLKISSIFFFFFFWLHYNLIMHCPCLSCAHYVLQRRSIPLWSTHHWHVMYTGCAKQPPCVCKCMVKSKYISWREDQRTSATDAKGPVVHQGKLSVLASIASVLHIWIRCEGHMTKCQHLTSWNNNAVWDCSFRWRKKMLTCDLCSLKRCRLTNSLIWHYLRS